MKRFKCSVLAVLALLSVFSMSLQAQTKPKCKVDLSFNRSNMDEIQEPGFINWIVPQGLTASKTVEGVTFTLSAPAEEGNELRPGWNKTAIQNADNKSKNGRLTYDGITIDPATFGTIKLKVSGLPVGTHNLQTYHNCWQNPDKFYAVPMNVLLDGQMAYEKVKCSFGQAVAANACILNFELKIEQDGQEVEITFLTTPENIVEPDGNQTDMYAPPFCNGFELNTDNVILQAKDPYPAAGDMHVDADSGSLLLSWTPANDQVMQHQLYLGEDSLKVSRMKSPTAVLEKGDTSYLLQDVYSMKTYFWRVDEVDAEGYVTKGKIWQFKPRQLAFPGAEGYGRYAQGGRGGVVYHVTNLSNERIPGSFIYGLLDVKGPKTIVFDVSGIIDMGFQAVFTQPNTTIAGQTAPGKGICIKGANINIGSDNICRHMRFKHGYGDTGNAMGMSGSNHAIVDHTTAAWGTDETVSGRGAKNISFQYSLIAEALGIADHKNYGSGTNHGYAATIDGKIGSWHHNLLVHCNGRNWSMGGGMDGENRAIGQMDIFNNVVYNWNGRTTDGNCHEVNFVGNYYKMGPDTRRTQLFIQQYENVGHPESTWRAYISGNIRENKNGSLSQDRKGDTYDVQLSNGATMPTYATVVDKPFFPSYAKIHSAQDAYKIVLSEAGATMPMRDDQHLRVVQETLNKTYTYVGSRSGIKGEIDHEKDAGGWEAYPEEKRSADFDSDQDGMPDWWENLTGSDADKADNNEDPDGDGWTLLEAYLEFMAHPYLVLEPGTEAVFDMSACFKGFTKNPQYSVSAETNLVQTQTEGASLQVKAGNKGGVEVLSLKVVDGDGSTHEKRLSVAVTGNPNAIPQVWSENDIEVAKREFFALDGRQVYELQSGQVYVMRLTDTEGRMHSVKIIKN